jgi:hypothetical protein
MKTSNNPRDLLFDPEAGPTDENLVYPNNPYDYYPI